MFLPLKLTQAYNYILQLHIDGINNSYSIDIKWNGYIDTHDMYLDCLMSVGLTFSSDDGSQSMVETFVLWVRLGLVVNKLNLYRLHGTDNHNRLGNASP